MDINQLTAWVAGRVEGAGEFWVTTEIGRKPYMAIAIQLNDVGDEMTANRLSVVANNGSLEGQTWHPGGYAAVRGFVETLWPYLTPETKRRINDAIKFYKQKKAALKNGG